MLKDNVIDLKKPEPFIEDPVTGILRSGARSLLALALEVEISSFLPDMSILAAISRLKSIRQKELEILIRKTCVNYYGYISCCY